MYLVYNKPQNITKKSGSKKTEVKSAIKMKLFTLAFPALKGYEDFFHVLSRTNSEKQIHPLISA